jgi:hypothetical protein
VLAVNEISRKRPDWDEKARVMGPGQPTRWPGLMRLPSDEETRPCFTRRHGTTRWLFRLPRKGCVMLKGRLG